MYCIFFKKSEFVDIKKTLYNVSLVDTFILSSFSVNWQMLRQSRELTKEGCILEASIEAGANEIIKIKDSLNEWDSKVGDGDCGTTVSHTSRTIFLLFSSYNPIAFKNITRFNLFRCIGGQLLYLMT